MTHQTSSRLSMFSGEVITAIKDVWPQLDEAEIMCVVPSRFLQSRFVHLLFVILSNSIYCCCCCCCCC